MKRPAALVRRQNRRLWLNGPQDRDMQDQSRGGNQEAPHTGAEAD